MTFIGSVTRGGGVSGGSCPISIRGQDRPQWHGKPWYRILKIWHHAAMITIPKFMMFIDSHPSWTSQTSTCSLVDCVPTAPTSKAKDCGVKSLPTEWVVMGLGHTFPLTLTSPTLKRQEGAVLMRVIVNFDKGCLKQSFISNERRKRPLFSLRTEVLLSYNL